MATWGQRIGSVNPGGQAPESSPDAQAAASSLREQWRSEQDAATADAADGFRHGRTLKDIAIESLHRGDPMVVVMPHVRFHGMVEAVGPDLLALRTVSGRVDVHLDAGVPLMLQIGERVREGGARDTVSDGDFRNALLARERLGEVTLGCTLLDEPVDGKIVMGADHVCLVGRGGAETYFPFSCVSYVMPRRD